MSSHGSERPRHVVPGENAPAARRGRHGPRHIRRRGDASRSRCALRSDRGQARLSSLTSRARCATGAWQAAQGCAAPPRGHGEGRAGRPDDQAALHAEMIRQAQGRQGVAKRGDIADYRPPAFRRHALRRSRSDCRVKTDATEQYYTPPTSGVAAGTMVGGGPTSKVYVRWLFTTAFASTPGTTRTTIGTPNAMAIGASLTRNTRAGTSRTGSMVWCGMSP